MSEQTSDVARPHGDRCVEAEALIADLRARAAHADAERDEALQRARTLRFTIGATARLLAQYEKDYTPGQTDSKEVGRG